MNSRCNNMERAYAFMERKRMHILDTQSCGRREHERRLEFEEKAVAGCTGKFRTGQSVLHWWSGWFASAIVPPLQLKKNRRPKWYDATIMMALGVRDATYAGRPWHRPCYQVH